MKKTVTFLLLLLASYVASFAATTVYFKNSCSWPNSMYCYTWTNGASDQNAPWPGVQMTLVGDNVYFYSSSTPFTNCIFTDNMFQTSDLVAQDGKVYDCHSNQWETYNVDPIAGQCGDHLSWSFADGILTISGTGDMYDFEIIDNYAPWHNIRNNITSAIIQDGATSIGNDAFLWCGNLSSISLGNTLKRIGEFAFNQCTSLTSIVIPNGTTDIGESAFNYCTSLSHIVIPNSVENIGISVFGGCNNLPIIDNIRYADTYLIEVIDKNLSSYTIKSGTKWIGAGAFESCTNMTSISIPNSVVGIRNFAFAGCSSLTSITIPNNVTEIRLRAFESCHSLTTVVLPNKISYIPMFAFADCTSLQSISIPNSVSAIGEWAFSGCTSLTSITIPSNITIIYGGAFGHCTNLKSVTCLATTPPSMTTDGWVSTGMEYVDVFSEVDCSKIPLYVPKGTEPLYAAVDQWEDFMQIIGIETSVESPVTSTTSSRKQIHDGQIYILRGDKTYTLQGQEVK